MAFEKILSPKSKIFQYFEKRGSIWCSAYSLIIIYGYSKKSGKILKCFCKSGQRYKKLWIRWRIICRSRWHGVAHVYCRLTRCGPVSRCPTSVCHNQAKAVWGSFYRVQRHAAACHYPVWCKSYKTIRGQKFYVIVLDRYAPRGPSIHFTVHTWRTWYTRVTITHAIWLCTRLFQFRIENVCSMEMIFSVLNLQPALVRHYLYQLFNSRMPIHILY